MGHYGIHCTERYDDCLSSSNAALCGHGTCINRPAAGNQTRYRCLCDQGWMVDASSRNPSCSMDVDECLEARYPCSVSPKVQCINLPGSFACAPCPPGYTGNGYTCFDVDECAVNNGGCSSSPLVQCTNTIGSRSCGPCPPGFAGDGQSCAFVGVCSLMNGNCHPLATCIENSGISSSYRQCRCPAGYTGSGFGASGCIPSTAEVSSSCSINPCLYGTCHPMMNGSFSCRCFPGYTGPLCSIRSDIMRNDCSFNPCRNGGTCVASASPAAGNSYSCVCTSEWQGVNCDVERSSCGGYLSSVAGSLIYPTASYVTTSTSLTYKPNLDCVWIISTEAAFVLNISFTKFDVEAGPDCGYDYLAVYDGPDHSYPVIKKMCGSVLPDAHISSHNAVYLWFHTDDGNHGSGFQLSWNSTEPACGGNLLPADFGSIKSPGYPGNYPHSRSCYWVINVPFGKRIMMSFASVSIESHPDCSFDFIKVFDGELVCVAFCT